MDIVEKLDDCALSIGLEWPPHHRQYVFETMKAAKAEIEKLRATESRLRSLTAEMAGALEFYANRESYRPRRIEEQRRLNGGVDPIVARSGVGKAKPGYALSDVQVDNCGDRARSALSRSQEGK